MKKAQRDIYHELLWQVDCLLCCFCRYHEKTFCGNDGDCEHPLSDRLDEQWGSYDMDPSDDCWGFRPTVPVACAADIVGVVLGKGWLVWWYEKDDVPGDVKVGGNNDVW